MKYTSNKIGEELKNQLLQGYDIPRISRWAYTLYYNNTRNLDEEMIDLLLMIARMQDDPQFEYTLQELQLLSQQLINGESISLD